MDYEGDGGKGSGSGERVAPDDVYKSVLRVCRHYGWVPDYVMERMTIREVNLAVEQSEWNRYEDNFPFMMADYRAHVRDLAIAGSKSKPVSFSEYWRGLIPQGAREELSIYTPAEVESFALLSRLDMLTNAGLIAARPREMRASGWNPG